MAVSLYVPRNPRKTILHQVFENHWVQFLQSVDAGGGEKYLPSFVKKEISDYFKCGIHEYGFVRLYCKDCKTSQYLAFSCKRRGFCPSCCGRRMNLSSAKMVDFVFPEVQTRQWVMSFPFELRYLMAYDSEITSLILRLFTNKVSCWYRKQARAQGIKHSKCGGVTVIQRAGGALNLNVHFHSIFIDGVYTKSKNAHLIFKRVRKPTPSDLEEVVDSVIKAVKKHLQRAAAEQEQGVESSPQLQLAMASITNHVATGERIGKRVRRVKQNLNNETFSKNAGVNKNGFSIHAGVSVPAKNRKKLEKLCRYISRGPLAQNRLYRLPGDRLGYTLKTQWRDGTSSIIFSPHELIEKLVALIPPPRANLTRFHGVLAPNAKWRKEIVPKKKPVKNTKQEDVAPQANMSWAAMMKRVFEIDVTICQHCKGELKLIAVIQDIKTARLILDSEGLRQPVPIFRRCPTRPPTQMDLENDTDQYNQTPPGW